MKCRRKRDVITGILLDGYNERNNGESEPARRQGDLCFRRRWCKPLLYWETHSVHDILDPRTRQALQYYVEGLLLCFTLYLFFKNFFLKDLSPFCGATHILVFGLQVMSALGFKAKIDPLACMLRCLHAVDSSDSTLVRHLLTSCRPSRFRFMYVHVLHIVSRTRTC